MRLYVKQQVWTIGSKFNVKDEYGTDRYYVEGEVFTIGKKLHVYDMYGNEEAYIAQKVWNFLPTYQVYVKGALIMEIRKEFTFFQPRYTAEGAGYSVEGDWWSHEFDIYYASGAVAHVSKKWFSFGDSYCIDLYGAGQEIPLLAIVLAIDCVLASQQD